MEEPPWLGVLSLKNIQADLNITFAFRIRVVSPGQMGLLVLGCMPEYVGDLTMSNSSPFYFFFFFLATLVLICPDLMVHQGR